jgi:XTP/dITP diphosphohydrolase
MPTKKNDVPKTRTAKKKSAPALTNSRLKKRLQKSVPTSTGKKFERLVDIVKLLRTDCPWDRAQTPDSLVHLTLEEVYEMIAAVDEKDDRELKKELGDILLHLCFQSVLASERKAFEMADVLDAIAEKLIFRHPHVFGTDEAETASDVNRNWEKLKMKEGRKSVLEGVPKAMPQLLRAFRVQEKAAGVSFDWERGDDVLKKIREEISELYAAQSDEAREEEFGDILFSLVNYSRFIKVNPEDALRKATEKFIRRFQTVEEQVAASGKSWDAFTLAELDEFWTLAKKQEKASPHSL